MSYARCARVGPYSSARDPRVEGTNILRRLERAEEIARAEANAAHEDVTQLSVELFDSYPFTERLWELRHAITSDDAWHVALAEALDLALATVDERLAKASHLHCDFLTPRAR